MESAVATGLSSGALSLRVERGVFYFKNSASADQIGQTELHSVCYAVDDQTVAKTNGSSTRSRAGIVRDFDANGVWVEVGTTV